MQSELRKEWLSNEIKKLRKVFDKQENMIRKYEDKKDTINFEIHKLTSSNLKLQEALCILLREFGGACSTNRTREEVTNPVPPQ